MWPLKNIYPVCFVALELGMLPALAILGSAIIEQLQI